MHLSDAYEHACRDGYSNGNHPCDFRAHKIPPCTSARDVKRLFVPSAGVVKHYCYTHSVSFLQAASLCTCEHFFVARPGCPSPCAGQDRARLLSGRIAAMTSSGQAAGNVIGMATRKNIRRLGSWRRMVLPNNPAPRATLPRHCPWHRALRHHDSVGTHVLGRYVAASEGHSCCTPSQMNATRGTSISGASVAESECLREAGVARSPYYQHTAIRQQEPGSYLPSMRNRCANRYVAEPTSLSVSFKLLLPLSTSVRG